MVTANCIPPCDPNDPVALPSNTPSPFAIFSGPPASSFIAPVVKADADLPDGLAKGLLVGTAGTITLMDESGNIHVDVPIQQGYNYISVRQVRLGGTADNIWALY